MFSFGVHIVLTLYRSFFSPAQIRLSLSVENSRSETSMSAVKLEMLTTVNVGQTNVLTLELVMKSVQAVNGNPPAPVHCSFQRLEG